MTTFLNQEFQHYDANFVFFLPPLTIRRALSLNIRRRRLLFTKDATSNPAINQALQNTFFCWIQKDKKTTSCAIQCSGGRALWDSLDTRTFREERELEFAIMKNRNRLEGNMSSFRTRCVNSREHWQQGFFVSVSFSVRQPPDRYRHHSTRRNFVLLVVFGVPF